MDMLLILQISKMSLIKQIKHILMNFNLNLEMRYKTIVIFSKSKEDIEKDPNVVKSAFSI